MEQKQVVVNGLLLSFIYQPAAGAKHTLLFLHGWRSNKEVWRGVVSQLSAVSCQLSALDLPGFGGSQVPPDGFTVGDYAHVVEEFIEKMGFKNVILVGHSFGGRVGIKLAASHPQIISKLVLVDSAGFAMGGSKKGAMSLGAKIVRPFFKPKFMQPLRKKIYQNIGAEDYLATPELQRTFVNTVSEDLSEDMKNIAVPTLIIYGQNDTDTPPAFGEKMQALIPNSKFLILNNAGHFSFLDKQQEFISELNNFIA